MDKHSNSNTLAVETELKQSYLDYAMSVIVGRALPDVRDGLKPVHRRILYAMHVLGNVYNKPHKKSARVVGDVIGKYHPHGDTAVYDAIVRMAQTFSMRYPLIDGQGNFGSVDGDSPAAMRYTEIRLTKFAHALLADLDKDTVNFVPNYDNTEFCPEVLPTRIPNLLVNGSSGIAVGMATNIPPHNLGEVLDACLHLIDQPDADTEALMQYVSGPDFPTAGIINGRAGIREAYRTGRGEISIQGKANIEQIATDKESIVFYELPYQVNKARVLEKIAALVKDKRIEGITALRDESDKDGMRLVIEARRGENVEVLLNNLYKLTQLQVSFGINMVALDGGIPQCRGLKPVLVAFIRHRKEVVIRRTIFELAKARRRAHILEGLALSLTHIDAIVALIKQAKTPLEAKEQLMNTVWEAQKIKQMLPDDSSLCRPDGLSTEYGMSTQGYHLSPEQAQAILDLKLQKLTGLEREKIIEEYNTLIHTISNLLEILAQRTRLMEVIREELLEIKSEFNDERKTEIVERCDFSDEDFIANETMMVTLSHAGYAKVQPVDTYQAQRRGGKGKTSSSMKEADHIEHFSVAQTHDTLLFFTSKGKVYWLKTYQLPITTRIAKGKPVINFIPLQSNEQITAMLPVSEFTDTQQIIMATAEGVIKKVKLSAFSKPRTSGVIAIDLNQEDSLIAVDITTGDQEIMLFSNEGKVIRFHEKAVRSMGRTARGVRGIRLKPKQKLVSLIVVRDDLQILSATANGYGKRTPLDQHRITARGSQGVIAVRTTPRNGKLIDAVQVKADSEVFLIGNKGTVIRTPVQDIALVSRNTQGVRLMHFTKDEKLIALKVIPEGQDIPDNDTSETPTDTVDTLH
jgi:DNA gyrase subunit A